MFTIISMSVVGAAILGISLKCIRQAGIISFAFLLPGLMFCFFGISNLLRLFHDSNRILDIRIGFKDFIPFLIGTVLVAISLAARNKYHNQMDREAEDEIEEKED